MRITFTRYRYSKRKDGTVVRRERKHPEHNYGCTTPRNWANEQHTRPFQWWGPTLDNEVWYFVCNNIIKNPKIIRRQVQARQNELQAQKDDVSSDIAKAHQKIAEIDSQRAFYQRQAAKGNITEDEFEQRMGETLEVRRYWEDQIEHLTELRDDAEKVKAGLDYSEELLNAMNGKLQEIGHSQEELRALPYEERESILLERQKIIYALCDKIWVYPDGRIEAEGVLDGSEMQHLSEPYSRESYHRVGV